MFPSRVYKSANSQTIVCLLYFLDYMTLFYVSECLPTFMCVHYMYNAHGGQQRALDPLEL